MERQNDLTDALQSSGFRPSVGYYHGKNRPGEEPVLAANSFHTLVPIINGNSIKQVLLVSWDLASKTYRLFEVWDLSPKPKQQAIGLFQPHHFFDVKYSNYLGSFDTAEAVVHFVKAAKHTVTSPT